MSKGDHLGEFELHVLLALAQLGGDAYGIRIRQDITARTGRDVAIGAVYATLERLLRKGLVVFTLSAPLPQPGGRARKLYTMTGAGRRALWHSTAMLGRMMAGLDLARQPRRRS
jgi:PadR family transcriptional regulator PadR